MIITKEEAETKWCPQLPPAPGARCIASQCMAWRWYGHVDGEGRMWEPTRFGGISVEVEVRRGFCGLAGAP